MNTNLKQNFSNGDQQNSLDPKYYLFKILGYWKLFFATILLSLIVARFINGYRTKLYSLKTMISVKEETNPLFSSGTSLTFNWGGASDIIETVNIILKSRTHNEKVVSKLQFYIDYLKEGNYRFEDIYGKTPFKVKLNESNYQLYNQLLKIETLENRQFRISTEFNLESPNKLVRYLDNDVSKKHETTDKNYSETFFFNQNDFDNSNVKTSFLDLNIFSIQSEIAPNQVFYIKFNSYNSTVSSLRNMKVKNVIDGASLLELELTGKSKNRIVDYLNESVKVLSKDKQEQKTLYATKTVNYIENLFKIEEDKLQNIQSQIGKFKKVNNIYNLSSEGSLLFTQTNDLTLNFKKIERNLEELNILETYIRSNTIYKSPVPVPAFIELADVKTSFIIDELILESTKLEFLKDKVKSIHPDYQKLVNKIEQIKLNLYENISNNRISLKRDLDKLAKELASYENKLKLLPEKEQGLLKYQKEYEFSEFYYSYFKQKKYEANAAIEASVSDVKVIDTAIDLGQKPIYPNPTFNYLVGIMLGIVLPLFYIIIRELLDNKIRTIDEIEKQYNIPLLGAVGRIKGMNNLIVFDSPKSVIAESFRALRSNIQFLFKNNTDKTVGKRAKTLLLTSSVSGEGKTMISINMATVFALSGKKTILIGMDLRKPKIFDDFEFNNDIGVVNYLINQKTISEITIKTKIPNLDVILSGPIPPNPSELLISENCDRFIQELEKEYDYIVIDTPPIGLVSDALELFKYSDAICYVIRQDYSERGMNAMIDTKYKNKEVSNISYIFNDFKSKNKHGYGYGYGYGYSEVYGNGYHEEEEPETLIKKIASFIKPKK